jgi:hypothetical protein
MRTDKRRKVGGREALGSKLGNGPLGGLGRGRKLASGSWGGSILAADKGLNSGPTRAASNCMGYIMSVLQLD